MKNVTESAIVVLVSPNNPFSVIITRGSVMSPGAIGARERVPAVETLRALGAVSVLVPHTSAML